MQIKANEELFVRWCSLGSRIEDLCSIVQNDIDISESQIRKWTIATRLLEVEYGQLVKDTLEYLDARRD